MAPTRQIWTVTDGHQWQSAHSGTMQHCIKDNGKLMNKWSTPPVTGGHNYSHILCPTDNQKQNSQSCQWVYGHYKNDCECLSAFNCKICNNKISNLQWYCLPCPQSSMQHRHSHSILARAELKQLLLPLFIWLLQLVWTGLCVYDDKTTKVWENLISLPASLLQWMGFTGLKRIQMISCTVMKVSSESEWMDWTVNVYGQGLKWVLRYKHSWLIP